MTVAESTLDSLVNGECAVVSELLATGAERRRFMDLGILPGTRIEAVMRSPMGNPVAYRVRGALVALRQGQARQIVIERPEEIST